MCNFCCKCLYLGQNWHLLHYNSWYRKQAKEALPQFAENCQSWWPCQFPILATSNTSSGSSRQSGQNDLASVWLPMSGFGSRQPQLESKVMFKILDLFFRQNTGILMWLEMFWLMHSFKIVFSKWPTLYAHCAVAASTRWQTNTLGVTSLGTRPILGTVSRPGHGLMGWAQAWFQWPLLSSSLRLIEDEKMGTSEIWKV